MEVDQIIGHDLNFIVTHRFGRIEHDPVDAVAIAHNGELLLPIANLHDVEHDLFMHEQVVVLSSVRANHLSGTGIFPAFK